MMFAIALGNDQVRHVVAQRGGARDAESGFGRRIELHDAALVAHDDHAIHGGLDHG